MYAVCMQHTYVTWSRLYVYLIEISRNFKSYQQTFDPCTKGREINEPGEETNPMKKIKKRLDRIINPLPRDEHDPIEVEYKIMCQANGVEFV